MWRSFLCCVLLAWTTASSAAVPPVQDVDFYPMGARFVFKVKAARNFEFTLPGAFNPESVRPLNPEGVESLRVERLAREDWIPPSFEPLKLQIDKKVREYNLLTARRAALQQTLASLSATLPEKLGGKDLILFIEDAQAIRLRVENELVDLTPAIEKAEEELERLNGEFDLKVPEGARFIVKVSGNFAGSDPLLLFEARTPAAGWGVRYQMDLNSSTGEIRARMNAHAWQRTGLGVEGNLSFHTRTPTFAVSAPTVNPLVVNLAPKPDPRIRQAAHAPEMLAKEALADFAEAPAPPVSKPAPAMISTLANVSVKGSGRVDGDGTMSDVFLGQLEFNSSPVLVAIPEQSREAWVVASMDSVPASLLPGMAELAVDGASTGRISIPDYGASQLFLPFGMASRLSVSKERLIGKTGSSWLGKGLLRDGYTIELKNGFDVEKEVTVKDRVPVPASDKITLELGRIEPTPTEHDKNGILTWKVLLKPGESLKIAVEYVLRYPGDDNLYFY